MNMFFYHLLANTVEISLIIYFFNITLGERKKNRFFGLVLFSLLIFYTLVNTFTKPPLTFMLAGTFVILVISLFYPKSILQKLGYAIIYIFATMSIEVVVALISQYFRIAYINDVRAIVICNIIRVIILLIVKKFINRKPVVTDDRLLLILIGFSTISMTIVYDKIISVLDEDFILGLNMSSVFILISSVFMLFYLVHIKHESNLMKAELIAIKKDNEAKKDYYNKITEYEKKISTARHDLINRITAILVSSENKNVEEQLRALANESASEKHGIYTDNTLINYVLSSKLNQIEINQENTHISICLYDDLLINPGDIGVVLGNILDNATEALSHITLDKRRLLIDITLDTGVLNITVENTYDPNYKRSDNRNRGYGLRSIKEIVENYGGYLLTKNGDVFTTRAVMINTTNVGKIV